MGFDSGFKGLSASVCEELSSRISCSEQILLATDLLHGYISYSRTS